MDVMLTALEGLKPGIAACLLLEYANGRFLLDCGYNDSQSPAQSPLSLPVPAKAIDSVILSHGHLGHCGLLPVLAREGFAGKVHCTADTSRIAALSMLEAALLQEEQKQYRASKKQPPASEPMYTEREVADCLRLFAAHDFGEQVAVDEHMTVELFRAGHCPGSAFVKLRLHQGHVQKEILYVSDMGAKGNDLDAEPVIRDRYDDLIVSTFRAARPDTGQIETELADIINQTRAAGGNVLIPVSSIDRRDAILQIIRDLAANERIPGVFVFLDSPIASRQCEALPLESSDLQVYPCLRPVDTVADSKSLNQIRGTAVIIAGSGRGGYGRIGFHLKNNATRPESAIVLFSSRSERVLDKSLADSRRMFSILGQEIEVRAQVYRLHDPTVHLDANVVMEWLGHLQSTPRHICIAHGEQRAKDEFRSTLQKSGVHSVQVPVAGEKISM